jgi:hypothetical protein
VRDANGQALIGDRRRRKANLNAIFGARFRLSTDFSGYTLFVRTIFSIICPFCQFRIFLEVEIFQSAFGGDPIKNPWRAVYCRHFRCEGNSRPELIGVMENGFACVNVKIPKRFRLFGDEKRSNRWRVMRAVEGRLLRAADPSMCWTGTGAAVFDRRGGSHGLGGRTASGWRRSMSRRNDTG